MMNHLIFCLETSQYAIDVYVSRLVKEFEVVKEKISDVTCADLYSFYCKSRTSHNLVSPSMFGRVVHKVGMDFFRLVHSHCD